jgi:hypothetical protein
MKTFTLKTIYKPDLDPELDPDPYSSKRLDPVPHPHIMNGDPKHCYKVPNTRRGAPGPVRERRGQQPGGALPAPGLPS